MYRLPIDLLNTVPPPVPSPMPAPLQPHLAVTIGTTTHLVATCWADLTLGAYARLLATDAAADTYGALAAAVGCTRSDIMAMPIPQAQALVEALAYLEGPLPTWALPATVALPVPGGAMLLEYPRNLEGCTFGQATDLGTLLEQYEGNPGQLRLAALAVYLMPAYYGGPYDSDNLAAFTEIVKEVRLGEGLPVADFFIWILSGLPSTTGASSKPYPLAAPKPRRGTKILPPAGKRMPWLTRWLGGTRYGWAWFFPNPGPK